MVDHGANPRIDNDRCFIEICLNCNDFTIPSYFINECGADINAQNGAALKRAFDYSYLQMARMLIDNGTSLTDNVLSEIMGHYNVDDAKLKLLIESGIEPDRICRLFLESFHKNYQKEFDKLKYFYDSECDVRQMIEQIANKN